MATRLRDPIEARRCAWFRRDHNESLSVAGLRVGGEGLTVSAHVCLAAKPGGRMGIAGKVGEFALYWSDEDDRFRFAIGDSLVVANRFGAPGIGAWVHVAGGYDPAERLVTLTVNGLLNAAEAAVTVAKRAAPLQIGALDREHHFNGAISRVSLWDRAVPLDQLPLEYEDLPGLVAWWDLGEESGVRRDRHAGHHLTDGNTVASIRAA